MSTWVSLSGGSVIRADDVASTTLRELEGSGMGLRGSPPRPLSGAPDGSEGARFFTTGFGAASSLCRGATGIGWMSVREAGGGGIDSDAGGATERGPGRERCGGGGTEGASRLLATGHDGRPDVGGIDPGGIEPGERKGGTLSRGV